MSEADDLRVRINRLTVAVVAHAANMTPQTLYSFVRGDTKSLRSDTRERVVAALERLEGDLRQPHGANQLEVGGDAYVPIPVYDVRAAAGGGAVMQDSEPLFYQLFRENWLRRKTPAPLASLALIEVSGDSMSGTLDSGDLILVDTTINTFNGEGIYVLLVEEALMVKRCSMEPDTGALLLISDNTRYAALRVTNRERTKIVGRVIWAGRSLL